MKEITNTLAKKKYIVLRTDETKTMQIVPQIVSTLRLELTFWDDSAGYLRKLKIEFNKYLFKKYLFKKSDKDCVSFKQVIMI